MLRLTLAGTAALIIAACAPTTWVKSGASQQDYATDSYQCEKDARQSGYFGGGLIGAANMVEFSQRCMVAHGWRRLDPGAAERAAPIIARVTEASAVRKACLVEIRQQPAFAPLLPHMSDIETGRFAASQMADTRHPSRSEIALYRDYVDRALRCFDPYLATVSMQMPAATPILREMEVSERAISARVVAGQITWGEAATEAQAGRDAARAKLKAIPL